VVTGHPSIVFVVVSDHEHAERLVEDVQPWLDQGLIRPFVVTAVADVLGVQDPRGRWTGGERGPVSCFAALAEGSYENIRVVAYQEIVRGSSGDPHTAAAARALGEALLYRKAPSQQLTTLNVIAPDDRVRGLPPDLVQLSVSANVVIAPEDRESPNHASFPLDDAGRLRTHGLMHLFVLAALWRHQEDGPLDGEREGSFNEIPHVVMVRGYGRVARAPMLVERIARTVFTQRRSAQWAAEAVNGVQAREPEHIARRQAARFLEVHASPFTFSPASPPAAPRLRTVTVLQAFSMMFSYILRGLRALPSEVRNHVSEVARRAIGEFAQSVTFGPESQMRVVGSATASSSAPDVVTATTDLAALLLERAGGASPTPPASGEAWQDLRGVAFALHDGSALPDGFDRPSDGVTTEIISDVALIAPDPLDGHFLVDDEVRVRLSTQARVPIRVNDAAQASFLEAELAELGADEELSRLRDWISWRRTSLTWHLADHVRAQFGAAEELLGKSLGRVRQGAANLDGALFEQARKRLLRGWSVWFVVTLLVSGGIYLYLDSQELAPTGRQLALYVASAVITWLGGWTVMFARYLRRLFQIEHRRDRENAEYSAAVSSAFHAADQIVRLGAGYQQLQDWAEITGWMLHHPEGELAGLDDVDDVDTALQTPASHRLGLASWDEGSMRRLAAIVGRNLFGRSWLSNLFVEYRDAAMAQLRYELGHDDATPAPDPDWDVRAPGPRPYLLEQLQGRELAKMWAQRSVGVVQSHLNEINPNDLLDTVEDQSGTSSAGDFLYGILADQRGRSVPADVAIFLWGNEARMHQRQRVAASILWSSNPIPDDVEGTREGLVWRTPVEERSVHDVLVVRVDRCAPVPFTDLELFAPALAPVVTVAEEAGDQPW
jgi:hypothetical protein